jgi:large subunit ribosomal protein L24
MKIRQGDEVVVIAGKDKGKRGRVLKVHPERDRVVVEGVNIITRHLRRNPQNPDAGGRVQRAAPIHVSNVMVWSDAAGRGVRIRMAGEGRNKHRVDAKTGAPVSAAGRKKDKAGRKGS